ncbi:hypothetical protein MMC28_009368 [Mycoblastus sanguinarius]|nr:hypothetical protein [Mycoblastus sanguinarius]
MGGGGTSNGHTRDEFRLTPNKTLRNPNGSIVPHILLWAVQLVALTSPPFRGRRTLCSVTILSLAILSQINPHFTNDIAIAQPFTIGWSVYLSTLEKILFSADPGPEASLWHVDKPAQEALSYAAFGLSKIRWATVIMLNMRGVRWNFEVKNIPKANKCSRRWFLAFQSLNLVYYMLMADLVVQLGIQMFYTGPDGQVGSLNNKYLTLRHPDWRWSFVKALVFGATPYYICCTQYTLFSIPAVCLGLSKAEVGATVTES